MLGNWNLQFLDLNSQRAYPLADDADGMTDAGDFQIPTDFLVEMEVVTHAGLDISPGQFFVYQIGAYATGYSIVVGYQPAVGDPVPVATALIARQLQGRNTVYALGGVAPFDDTTGKVVIGRLDNIDQQPPGLWTFSFPHTKLDTDVIRPYLRGVSSITVVNQGVASAKLVGDIELVAGTNMRIVPVLLAGQDPVLQFNCINGEGTVDTCTCTGQDISAPPVQTINGVAPTSAGDFTLVGDECLTISATANGLKITDTCSKPCCGCPELEVITRDLEKLQQEAASVQQFVDSLGNAVNTMNSTVLGSKLSDQGCFSC